MKKNFINVFFCLITLTLIFSIGSKVRAAEYTVSPGQSIQNTVNTANPGDFIQVKTGSYAERVTISKNIRLECLGSCIVSGFIIKGNNVNIKGFEITYIDSSKYGIEVVSGSGTRLENNYIHDTTRDGILLKQESTNCTVYNNQIVRASQSCIEVRGTNHTIEANDCSKTIQYPDSWPNALGPYSDADCFRYFGSGHLFKNNYCHDVTYGQQTGGNNLDPHIDGFQTWGDTSRGLSHDIVFDGNTVILSGSGGGFTNKSVQMEGGVYNLTFKNNLFKTTLGAAITSTVSNITFDHNTWIGDKTNNGTWGIDAQNCTNCKVTNNIFAYHINGAGYLRSNSSIISNNNCIWQSGGSRPSDPGDVRENPLFLDELLNNFRLQNKSPACKSGENGTDIGAFPCGTSSPSPSPSPTHTATPTVTVKPLIPGDIYGPTGVPDGRVDVYDYTYMLGQYGKKGAVGFTTADITGITGVPDGKVDVFDYTMLIAN